MAYSYKNQTKFIRPAKVHFIVASDSKFCDFAVESFNADNLDSVPAGAVRASDNLATAEQEAVEANVAAGYIYNEETRSYQKAPQAGEPFTKFPAEFTSTQQAEALASGRSLLRRGPRYTVAEGQARLADKNKAGSSEVPVDQYLLTIPEFWIGA